MPRFLFAGVGGCSRNTPWSVDTFSTTFLSVNSLDVTQVSGSLRQATQLAKISLLVKLYPQQPPDELCAYIERGMEDEGLTNASCTFKHMPVWRNKYIYRFDIQASGRSPYAEVFFGKDLESKSLLNLVTLYLRFQRVKDWQTISTNDSHDTHSDFLQALE